MNLIADGIFQYLPAAAQGPFTDHGARITFHGDANKCWYIGPGVRGTVGVSGFPNPPGPGMVMNLEWFAPPSFDSIDPNADGQVTILEYHIMGAVPATSGKTLRLTFQAMVGSGPLDLVPIIWVNYKDYRYWIDLGPRVTIPLYLPPNAWTTYTADFVLPSAGSRLMDASEYVGVGLDYPTQPGGQHPFQLLLGNFSLEIV